MPRVRRARAVRVNFDGLRSTHSTNFSIDYSTNYWSVLAPFIHRGNK